MLVSLADEDVVPAGHQAGTWAPSSQSSFMLLGSPSVLPVTRQYGRCAARRGNSRVRRYPAGVRL
ncbi:MULTISPECIES: hypothetical protein [Streptomyces]|uniref:hypothetical protein n=1 Tax=Streptomyces TaxID=1883 RepID=UPI00103D330D|nr:MULTISPECIES: hypothetical protein [Streptomyces]MBT3077601.1 hypothetical protein [Streptomyces sp. COG21]MBT3084447.1 hypothetical protein [Streptomyces sp. COG20]MBT3085354.1 hypothetical protein [Streptomyces sp. CYG21]MBT3095926.1 hypothetical protein [Streptomyces sp. CBG30]MBT3103603.1 hypothetical protein [Streptomyces sp. COG19]